MDLEEILAKPDGLDKTAALAAWFQALFEGRSVPILVGGAAVELLTDGAYQTGDLDFVGIVPQRVADQLEENGFHRSGRHWVHEVGQVFIELPSSQLEKGEQAVDLKVGGLTILTVGAEELVIDRLAAWQFWGSEEDGVNAFLIWRANPLSAERLRMLSRPRGVEASLKRLEAFRRSLADRDPSATELSQWAKRQQE